MRGELSRRIFADVWLTRVICSMKNKDEMTEAIAELSKHFPAFKRHLLDERDLYLCHALVRTAQHSVSRAF